MDKKDIEKVTPKFLWGGSTPDWQNEASALMRFKDEKVEDNLENESKKYYLRDRK